MSVSSPAQSPTPAAYSERMTDLPGPAKSSDGKDLTLFAEGDAEPSFWDALDVINPLQHIPVLNQVYREMTGDKIGVGARMAGGTLFGGVIGLVAAVADCAVEGTTGDDVGGHVLALFRDGEAPADGETAIAAKQPDSQPAAAPAQIAAAAAVAGTEAAQAAPSVIPGPMATPGMAALTAAAPKAAPAQTAAAQAATQKPIPLTSQLPATATPQAVSPLTAAKPGPIPGPIATPGLLTMAQAAGQQTGQTIADATAQDLALQTQAALSGQGDKETAKPITVAQADPGTLQTFDGALPSPALQQGVKFRPVPQRTGPATPKPVVPPHEASLLGVGSRQAQQASAHQAVTQPPATQAQAAPTPPSPAAAAPGQADWFANNVMQGLEKYQQQPKSKP